MRIARNCASIALEMDIRLGIEVQNPHAKNARKTQYSIASEKAETRKTVPINQNTALHQSISQFDTVVLSTAIISVIASDCSILKCRVLLDSGAQLRMMTEDCAQRLQKRTPAAMRDSYFQNSTTISSK